jgi:hypothetical protein
VGGLCKVFRCNQQRGEKREERGGGARQHLARVGAVLARLQHKLQLLPVRLCYKKVQKCPGSPLPAPAPKPKPVLRGQGPNPEPWNQSVVGGPSRQHTRCQAAHLGGEGWRGVVGRLEGLSRRVLAPDCVEDVHGRGEAQLGAQALHEVWELAKVQLPYLLANEMND